MKHVIKSIIRKTGYSIVRADAQMGMVSWANDRSFEMVAREVQPYTLLGRDRLFTLWQVVKQARGLPGSMAQIGVFRGGSARLIALARTNAETPFYLFDTFEGMPAVDAQIDIHKEGDFKDTSLAAVKRLFSDIGNVVFCPGIFPASSTPASKDSFSFVYVDVDIYRSVIDCLHFFFPRLIPGGYIVLDDYMGKHTPGVKKALDEFFVDKKERPFITAIGQCMIIKQP